MNIVRQLTVPRWRWVEDEHGGRSVRDGLIVGVVELTIDDDALVQVLGARALRNKSGRAQLGGRMVMARRLRVVVVNENGAGRP